jgi:hypothetical protein
MPSDVFSIAVSESCTRTRDTGHEGQGTRWLVAGAGPSVGGEALRRPLFRARARRHSTTSVKWCCSGRRRRVGESSIMYCGVLGAGPLGARLAARSAAARIWAIVAGLSLSGGSFACCVSHAVVAARYALRAHGVRAEGEGLAVLSVLLAGGACLLLCFATCLSPSLLVCMAHGLPLAACHIRRAAPRRCVRAPPHGLTHTQLTARRRARRDGHTNTNSKILRSLYKKRKRE